MNVYGPGQRPLEIRGLSPFVPMPISIERRYKKV
jgi:hypothetical protein